MTASSRIARAVLTAATLMLGGTAPALAETAGAIERSQLPVVTLATAESTPIKARVPVSGSLVARQRVQIHANVSGYEIQGILADVGDQVNKGDVLAVLSDDALTVQYEQATAEYRRAEAAVRQAESQIDSAVATLTEAASALDRTQSLRRSGNASQAVLDQAIAAEASAQAASALASSGLIVARATLAQAEAARRLARLNLDYARIKAPVDGVVIERTAELGAIANTGGDPLFTMVGGGEIELAADVIETALGQLKAGDSAEIEVAGIGTVMGEVRLVPAAVDPLTRLGLTRISLASDARLRVGLFASGWITTDQRDAITVPTAAVLADGASTRVQVVTDGRVETREVRAGLTWQGRREIIEGLAPGEQVIARAGAFFNSGDQVRTAP